MDKKTKRQNDKKTKKNNKKTKRQREKRIIRQEDKDQKEILLLRRQGNFALLPCY